MIDFIITVLAVLGSFAIYGWIAKYRRDKRRFEFMAREFARQEVFEVMQAAGPDVPRHVQAALLRSLAEALRKSADVALSVGNMPACSLLNRASEIIHEEAYK